MRPDDDWAMICRLLRRYGLHKYGLDVEAITLHLRGGVGHQEPVPCRDLAEFFGENRTLRPVPWASGPGPKHLSDFQKVWWPPLGEFAFSPKQSLVMKALWKAWQEGLPSVAQSELLRAAESECPRLLDLFRNHPAWNRLIVQAGPGLYKLAPAPEEYEGDNE